VTVEYEGPRTISSPTAQSLAAATVIEVSPALALCVNLVHVVEGPFPYIPNYPLTTNCLFPAT